MVKDFIMVRNENERIMVDIIKIKDSVDNPQKSLREAVKEYLQTEDGKIDIENNCDNFNWADAISNVPVEILNKYGIVAIQEDVPNVITVDNNESLNINLLND